MLTIIGAVLSVVGASLFYRSYQGEQGENELESQLISEKEVVELDVQSRSGLEEAEDMQPKRDLVSIKCDFLQYYGDESSMPFHDIEAVGRLFDLAVRQRLFSDHEAIDNRILLKILLGKNSQGLKFELPETLHQNDALVDRWGKPLLIHQVSGTKIGVRSAGPDGRMSTSDDVFVEPVSPFPIGSDHL